MVFPARAGVQLPSSSGGRPSAAVFLRETLQNVAAQFPEVFAKTRIPGLSPYIFKRRRLARLIETFETVRGPSDARLAVAQYAADRIQGSVELVRGGRRVSLSDAFTEPAIPLTIQEVDRGRWSESRGQALNPVDHNHDALRLHIERLASDRLATKEAVSALRWTLEAIQKGTLNLAGERFVLLGGTAELTPLGLLLSLGADVLTTHSSLETIKARLAADLGSPGQYRGRVFIVPGGVDLLNTPVEFSRTILKFAAGTPLHIGALAYKGGQAREWRLAAAMDGIARAVNEAGLLRSIFYYLTPSMPMEVGNDTAACARGRLEASVGPATTAARFLTFDTLFRPNIVTGGRGYWTRGVLPEQGASYMAANLFGKIYAAERFAAAGPADTRRVLVSANVAPITATTSTATAQTRRLFPELTRLGVEVYSPSSTRRLMGWLLLHDLFGPDRSSSRRVTFDQQVHGGVFTNPWSLNSVMKMAYLRALSRHPLGGR